MVDGEVYDVGTIEPRATFQQTFNPANGRPLSEFVQRNGGNFAQAVERRRNPLGGSSGSPPENRPLTVAAASFYRALDGMDASQRTIVGVPGLDLSAEVRRGDAVVLAWDAGHTLTKPINQFQPIRQRRDTMLRLVVPVKRI